MKMEHNNVKYLQFIFLLLYYTFSISLFAQDTFKKLANGEILSLTSSKPHQIVQTKKGDVSTIGALNLAEELDIIVSFRGKPLCLLEKSIRLSKTTDLTAEHDAFKSGLNNLVQTFQKKRNVTQPFSLEYNLKYEYFQAFNGVSMRCDRGLVDMIQSLPMVENVYQDREVQVNLEYSVHQIRADKVRNELGLNGENVLVGIVDTGIDYMHPALGGGYGGNYRIIGGYDFVNGDGDPMDDHGHGTHVTGIVGASSDSLNGVAPGVNFLAVKVLGQDGSGSTSAVIAGIDYCLNPDGNPGTDDAVDIMNFSLGASPEIDDPLEIAVNNASEAGILAVIAAGNRGNWGFESITSPGTAEKALTVGACDSAFGLAPFSSRGPDAIHFAIKPEIVAPGVQINSSFLNGETKSLSGTSMATPHVTGIAAILIEQHPDWTVDQIKWAIVNSASPLAEDYNHFEQGTGCVDAWNAAHIEIIIQPGVLSFSKVNLEHDVWRDTVSFAIENMGAQSREIRLERDDNLPVDVQLNLSQSVVTLSPGEKEILIAEIVVPSSVPIVQEEPFAYYGNLKCISSTDTINIPFEFTKENMLIVECDIPPDYLILWKPNTMYNQKILSEIGQTKHYFRAPQGIYNLIAAMHSVNDTSFNVYFVELKDVEIGGLTYQTIIHNQAEFLAFPGPFYDNDNIARTDDDLINRIVEIQLNQKVGNDISIISMLISNKKNDKIFVSQFDSSLSIGTVQLWKPVEDLLALTYQVKGIQKAEDVNPPSGPENIISINVHYSELNENMIVPGLPTEEDNQTVFWNTYEFDSTSVGKTSLGNEFEKTEFSKISMLTSPISINPDNFNTISLGMQRENREFICNDIWIDESGQPFIFERAGIRFRASEQLIKRRVITSGDTLKFNPGEEIFLPVMDRITVFGSDLLLISLRGDAEIAVSPTGLFEEAFSSINVNQPVFNYNLYDKTVANSLFHFGPLYVKSSAKQGVRYSLRGNSTNYYLLEQNGHSYIDYEFFMPEGNGAEAGPPIMDQFIVLSDGKPASWLKPSGIENKIRLLLYDTQHNINDIKCFLIPSSGQKITLDLDIDSESREVFAPVPDTLPHEFIDFQMIVSDSSGNQTAFTAAPSFFYGNSLDERIYDSRVFLYKYNLENVEQFPFMKGDSLSLKLDFTNNGNLTADSIIISYPQTSVFQPIGQNSTVISNLSVGGNASVYLNLELLIENLEDKHFVYCPEIQWKTNGKSYKRNYPIYIKTWEPKLISDVSVKETSMPLTYQLYNNYPNPFNLSTTISFQIPRIENVYLAIYNIQGQLVKTLTNRTYKEGNHKIVWNGTNSVGETVASGIYFTRIVAGDFMKSNKMLLIK